MTSYRPIFVRNRSCCGNVLFIMQPSYRAIICENSSKRLLNLVLFSVVKSEWEILFRFIRVGRTNSQCALFPALRCGAAASFLCYCCYLTCPVPMTLFTGYNQQITPETFKPALKIEPARRLFFSSD